MDGLDVAKAAAFDNAESALSLTSFPAKAMFEPMITALQAITLPGWRGLKISGRVDAFNDRQIIQSFQQSTQNWQRVAVDLSEVEFLSLQMLKFLSELGQELGRNGGELALVRPSHSLRRQVEIFFGPKVFNMYRSPEELLLGFQAQPRAEFQSALVEASPNEIF